MRAFAGIAILSCTLAVFVDSGRADRGTSFYQSWCGRDISSADLRYHIDGGALLVHPESPPLPGGATGASAYGFPKAVEKLSIEGATSTDGAAYRASQDAASDMQKMLGAAMRFRASEGQSIDQRAQLLKVVQRYLDSWTQTYNPRDSLGEPVSNPINETNFSKLLSSYALVKGELPTSSDLRYRKWIESWAWAYVVDIERNWEKVVERYDPESILKGTNIYNNNWQSYRIALLTKAAVVTGDAKLFDKAENFFVKHIEVNFIDSTGVSRDFLQRDAVHYAVYNSLPLVQAALAARTPPFSRDWFSYRSQSHGVSLETALDWIIPYAVNERHSDHVAHVEFARSRLTIDIERKLNKFPGYVGSFDRVKAANLFWMASALSQKYLPLALELRQIAIDRKDWKMLEEQRFFDVCRN